MTPPADREARVVVLPVRATSDAELAQSLARDVEAVVVLLGENAEDLGAIASEIRAAGGRAAVVVGDARRAVVRAAVAEMLDELFSTPRTEGS